MTVKVLALLLHVYSACNMPMGVNLYSYAALVAYLDGTINAYEFTVRATLPDSRLFARVDCIIDEAEAHQ